ncbi:MAG: response regulator, partial [Gammaproteobacteria bacterium]|nr:response regulator [Gammaproteobacteria bacterium]
MKNVLKLLLVDDSKILRNAISAMFSGDENITIEQAENGAEALEVLQWFKPDVVTLDINMPVMDGISALKRMMIEHPVPTVMLSSLAQEGSDITFDALRYGAVDFISKPDALKSVSLEQQTDEIRERIYYAADVELAAIRYIRAKAAVAKTSKGVDGKCQFIVAMGAAEGGYGALMKIIPHLSAHSSATYLVSLYTTVEHVDEFVNYLNNYSQIEVKSARHDEVLQPGVCYICSG